MSTPSPHQGTGVDSLHEALRASEARFAGFMAHLPALCWIVDGDDRLAYLNEAFARTLGVDATAAIGQSIFQTLAEPVAKAFTAKNGQVRQTRSAAETTVQIARHDGTLGLYHVTSFPVTAGGDAHLGGIAIEVTERRRFEQQLRQSQRLESLGLLAEGAAHNFNNMLTIIRVNAELLSLIPMLPPDAVRHAQQITEAAERSAHLTTQLLAFSRQQAATEGIFDLNEVVRHIMDLLAILLGRKISIDAQLAPEPVRLEGDAAMVEQVLFTLALNARDALPSGGRFGIEIDTHAVAPAEAARHRGVEPGPHARLTVRDNGVGMPPEVLARAFEPFFTTKGGRHTGLGLSTVHGYVTQHHGWIEAVSAPGAGATFVIHLPLAKPPPAIA